MREEGAFSAKQLITHISKILCSMVERLKSNRKHEAVKLVRFGYALQTWAPLRVPKSIEAAILPTL